MGNYILPSSSLLFRTDLDSLITSPIFFTLRNSLEALFSILYFYSVEVNLSTFWLFCVFLIRKLIGLIF